MVRKPPPLPSEGEAAPGAALALANARRHLRAAEVLRDARLYGPGVSHLVLAVEELAKAWLLTMHAMGHEVPERMLVGILRDHSARHALTFGDVVAASILHVADRAAKRVQRRHRVKGYPPELQAEWVKELTDAVGALSQKSPATEPVLSLVDWIANARARKTSGFYVDFTAAGWLHPGRISAKQFRSDHAITRAFVQRRGRLITDLLRSGFRADAQLKERVRKSMEGLDGATPQELIARMVQTLLGGPTE